MANRSALICVAHALGGLLNYQRQFEARTPDNCDTVAAMLFDPAEATSFTIDHFPDSERNSVRIVNPGADEGVLFTYVDAIYINVRLKNSGDPISGTALVEITDLPGDGMARTFAKPGVAGFVESMLALVTSAIEVTFSSGAANFIVEVILVGRTSESPSS